MRFPDSTRRFRPLGLVAATIAAGSLLLLAPPSSVARSAARSEPRSTAVVAKNASAPVLLFGIGVHIEPFGTTAQGVNRVGARGRGGRVPDYHEVAFFERHVEDLRTLAALVESHGGRLTVQGQSPFTAVATRQRETVLADLAARGHEIALHFHEDPHLGPVSERQPVARWQAVMSEEIELLRRAGAPEVRFWSGGNLFPGVLDAAFAAGLEVMSDYKNPHTQRADRSVLGVNPWRPAGGPREGDLAEFARHDPEGAIIYLPDGLFPDAGFNGHGHQGRDDNSYFDYLADAVTLSAEAARADRVNVFHITVHPGEFRGGRGASPFAVIERFLSETVDPLVRSGRARWATFSEMADAFRAWEEANPDVEPRSNPSTSSAAPSTSTGSLPAPAAGPHAVAAPRRPAEHGTMTFAVNVDDFRHPDESADTLLRLLDLFTRHGVRGDFYLTAPIAELYAQRRPDVLARLRETGMTVSYHVRPPHPLYDGFDQRLQGLDGAALEATLRDYETQGLDLATGDLRRGEAGGYALVSRLLGQQPVTVGAPNGDPAVRAAALRIYRSLGARAVVAYHEEGTSITEPLRTRQGLLERPSDFSITRWAVGGGRDQFWWNMLGGRLAADYDPVSYLAKRLAAWQAPRAPFVTALIHESNFYRRAATPWALVYYADERKTQPLDPPFDLDAPDPSRPRASSDQAAIWRAYEELVTYAARHLRVVTSADLVELAAAGS